MADFGIGEAIALGAAAAGTATTIYSTETQKSTARKAQAAALEAGKPPIGKQTAVNADGTRQANAAAALAGIPGTLLTGASGIAPNSLSTGKTVLGG